MMTEGRTESRAHRDRSKQKINQDNKGSKMVSTHPPTSPNKESNTKQANDSKQEETQENQTRASRPRSRRPSLPKRQLSRTDSTMVELTTETTEPVIFRRSPELPDVSDVAKNNNKDVGGSTTVLYRRRGSGSVKRKLTRTDSTMMVVTCDPENLALKMEPTSLDGSGSRTPENFSLGLLEDLEEVASLTPQSSYGGDVLSRSAKSPPILVSEHVEAAKISVTRQQSLVGTVLKNHQRRLERQTSLPNSSSCPNLVKTGRALDAAFVKQKLRSCRSSDARLNDKCKQSDSRPSSASSAQLLKVPDIFTTSFQSSSKGSGSSEELHKLDANSGRKNYRHSAPELTALPPTLAQDPNGKLGGDRTNLTKSFSDNPPRERRATLKTLSDSRVKMFQSVDDPLPPPPPFTPIVGQVVEGLFLGNIESTFCERLLCKNNIGSVVDVSGCPPDAVPEHKRSDVPCACGNDSRHLRASLRLCLAEANPSELREMLEKTNKFIEGARNKNKAALVNCYYGNHWSALAVMYYLMTTRAMNLRKAYSVVMMHRSDVELTLDNKQFLQQVEKTLFEPCDQSLCFEAADDSNAMLPREAWADD